MPRDDVQTPPAYLLSRNRAGPEVDPLRGGPGARARWHDERAYYLKRLCPAHRRDFFSSAHESHALSQQMYLNGPGRDRTGRQVLPRARRSRIFPTKAAGFEDRRASRVAESPSGLQLRPEHLMFREWRSAQHRNLRGRPNLDWTPPPRDIFVLLLSNRVNPHARRTHKDQPRSVSQLADAVMSEPCFNPAQHLPTPRSR